MRMLIWKLDVVTLIDIEISLWRVTDAANMEVKELNQATN